ncbi:MAG: alpha/beta hydrolase [Methylobacterium sp.]
MTADTASILRDPALPHPIAHLAVAGPAPTVVWLGGYRSDMRGSKAERLAAGAGPDTYAFLRFDYSGHGESGGAFEDGTISRWSEDASGAIEALAPGPLILVGSSMGAWIALRLTAHLRARGEGARLKGLLLLAPAPDFTGRLLEPSLTAEEHASLAREGRILRPSPYGEPTLYTRALIEDGAAAAVMDRPIETGCPVRIIQGMEDAEVPFAHALELVAHLPADGVTLTLVRDGDHRLSREEDLLRMTRALEELLAAARD